MESLIPGVHASMAALLSFDQSIELRAFLLRRDAGNLLVYSTASLATDAPPSRSSAVSPGTIWAMVTKRPTATPRSRPHSGRGPWHAMPDEADARRLIDAIIDRLRRGDDH